MRYLVFFPLFRIFLFIQLISVISLITLLNDYFRMGNNAERWWVHCAIVLNMYFSLLILDLNFFDMFEFCSQSNSSIRHLNYCIYRSVVIHYLNVHLVCTKSILQDQYIFHHNDIGTYSTNNIRLHT